MATYKVLQDIEAEDKILGPLTLRQFIYGLIAAFFAYMSAISVMKHAAILLVVLAPPMLFAAFFAFPFGRDQPTELWALAKIRFLFKSRKRIWDQSGAKELVTITAPKRIETQRTDGLSQTEVKSRLELLANTIDTRGWAVKNVPANQLIQPTNGPVDDSDRLLNLSSMPRPVPEFDPADETDVMDENSSQLAQQFSGLLNASEQTRRQKLLAKLQDLKSSAGQMPTQLGPTAAAQPAVVEQPQPGGQPQWFAKSPIAAPQPIGVASVVDPSVAGAPAGVAAIQAPAAIAPAGPATVNPYQAPAAQAAEPTATEEAVVEQLRQRQAALAQTNSHLHTIPTHNDQATQPAAGQAPDSQPAAASQLQPPVTPQPDPAILSLANNNDLNVATLARQANKPKVSDDGEVVIALH